MKSEFWIHVWFQCKHTILVSYIPRDCNCIAIRWARGNLSRSCLSGFDFTRIQYVQSESFSTGHHILIEPNTPTINSVRNHIIYQFTKVSPQQWRMAIREWSNQGFWFQHVQESQERLGTGTWKHCKVYSLQFTVYCIYSEQTFIQIEDYSKCLVRWTFDFQSE